MASTYDEILRRLYAKAATQKTVTVEAPSAVGLMAQRPGVRTPAMQEENTPASSMDYVTDFVTKIAASASAKPAPQAQQQIDPLTTSATDLYDGYNTALYNFYRLNEGTENPIVEDNDYRDTALSYLNRWLTSEDESEAPAMQEEAPVVEDEAHTYEEPFFTKPTRKVIDETVTADDVGADGMQPAGKEFSFESTSRRLVEDLKRDFDLTDMQAAAFVGNLAVETDNFNALQEYKPVVEGSKGGYGFAQWTGPRRVAYEKWAEENELDPASYEANYGYLKYELSNKDDIIQNMGRNTIRDLKEAKDLDAATRIVMDGYLRPGTPHFKKRQNATKSVLDLLN